MVAGRFWISFLDDRDLLLGVDGGGMVTFARVVFSRMDP